jgi:hypothetical protein
VWTRQLDYFEVEVTTFKPDPITESLRGQYPADCDWFRSLLEPDPVVLDVSAVQETGYNPKSRTRDVDWGKLIIFFNNGQAYTRLLEHSGWCLRDPIRAQQATGSAEFLDETGESFFVSLRNAITRVQALHLLDCWLSTSEKSIELEKVPEPAWNDGQ